MKLDNFRWKDPNRKRNINAVFSSPDYCLFYDIDTQDFTYLVLKRKSGQVLTNAENDRYGIYILTISLIVQESPKFKSKPKYEREEMLDEQYFDLMKGLTNYDPTRGSRLFSYAYRIAWVAAIHYYTNKIDDFKKKQAIEQHCNEELEYYLNEFIDHKKRNINEVK